MLDISLLLDLVVSTYQDVPEIVAAMDGEVAAIYAFHPIRPGSPNYLDMLSKMAWPSMMVSHVSTEFGYRGNNTQWRHVLRVDIKVMGDVTSYGALLKVLINGVPVHGDGLSILQCSFTDATDSLEAPIFTRQTDAKSGADYYRFEFALQERLDTVESI